MPLVTVYSVGNRDWDTHGNNFQHAQRTRCCRRWTGACRRCSKTCDSRGLLDETLVVWMGDMGRTPRINGGAGRDHWSFCYSIVMAGGGIRGGQVYGSSDRSAAYPSTSPVHPADIAATIYTAWASIPAATSRISKAARSWPARGGRYSGVVGISVGFLPPLRRGGRGG